MGVFMKKISICSSCYNEEGNIKELVERIREVMKKEKYDYEIIFSDNASTDNTQKILKELALEDKKIKVIINNRNYGPRKSPKNALRHASGDAIISIASDLQDPPEMIAEMLRWWEKGYKMVYGQKISSEEGKIKYKLRDIYYKVINLFSDYDQIPHISGICLNDKVVLKELLAADEDLSFRVIIPQLGYPIKLLPYKQKKRKYGKTSFSIIRYLDFAIDSLITSSSSPIRIATITGACLSVIFFLIAVVFFVLKLIYWHMFSAGIIPILICICLIGAVQIFFIGLIGEYILVILKRVTKELPLIEKELINFEEENG